MKLRHFAVFGGIFTVIICLLLFLFIVTADDEESGSSSLDFSGLNLSQEVLKHQPTVEKYAKEYGISDYVNYLFAIMQVESGGTGTTDVMQAAIFFYGNLILIGDFNTAGFILCEADRQLKGVLLSVFCHIINEAAAIVIGLYHRVDVTAFRFCGFQKLREVFTSLFDGILHGQGIKRQS